MGKTIRITESQMSDFISEAKNKKSKKDFQKDVIKSDRKVRREEYRERYGDGFKSDTRVHKSQKNYSRKGKNKFKTDDFSDD
jgi:hypothetical protein